MIQNRIGFLQPKCGEDIHRYFSPKTRFLVLSIPFFFLVIFRAIYRWVDPTGEYHVLSIATFADNCSHFAFHISSLVFECALFSSCSYRIGFANSILNLRLRKPALVYSLECVFSKNDFRHYVYIKLCQCHSRPRSGIH